MKSDFKLGRNGFTLIEVLIVVAIIGILTTILIANYNQARENSRDKIRRSELKELQLAIELYKSQYSSYPPDLTALVPTFVASVPTDPSGGSYTFNSNSTSYKLMTSNVESLFITSFDDEFARCPRQGVNCPSVASIQSTYAVYSAGAEDW